MSNEESFRILSIDGGGIKGLYSAVILAEFEEKYGKLNTHFDLICGTSTVALGIAAGIPVKEIVHLYIENGPRIFPYKAKPYRFWGILKQGLFSSKYPESRLREALTYCKSDAFPKRQQVHCIR